ncbi:MAG TPA: hypothetical protein VGM60_22805 [Pseudonocardia sp.]|jgi:hypothetical protein|uniref:hypothetical protein n=1 Tax=Pseudonocardia sp. TaxID=60912 RepID=UPI002F42E36A
MIEPTKRFDLTVHIDYFQVNIFDPASGFTPGTDAVLAGMDRAHESNAFVESIGGLIILISPVQNNFNAPMAVEQWNQEPPNDQNSWDHVVDVDLDCPSGQLLFQESGSSYGGPEDCVSVQIDPGVYRVRVAGRGYAAHGLRAISVGADSYRLQLWPRSVNSASTVRKAWPGWQ